MTTSVWYHAEGCAPEVVDRFSTRREAETMAHEYRMAFGCAPGQHRYGKDRVWAGRRDEESGERPATRVTPSRTLYRLY